MRNACCEERKGYGAKSQAQGALNDILVYPCLMKNTKIPRTKNQISNKFQSPNSKF
jgi:hypothetical protein